MCQAITLSITAFEERIYFFSWQSRVIDYCLKISFADCALFIFGNEISNRLKFRNREDFLCRTQVFVRNEVGVLGKEIINQYFLFLMGKNS